MATTDERLPPHSPKTLRWFGRYCRWYVPRRFHRVMVSGDVPFGHEGPKSGGVIFYMNHPGWFDPLMGILLAEQYFREMTHFAVIDAAMLEQYKFFQKMGFIGVEQDSPRGGVQFLRQAMRILSKPGRSLWVTAQGEFSDVRERPVVLQPGLAHLATRMKTGMIVPVAVEYAFWMESKPEALIRFGKPLEIEQLGDHDVAAWQQRLTDELTETMDALAALSLAKDADCFVTMLGGQAGVGGVYDLWRRCKAALTGKRFQASHGAAMAEAKGSQS